MQAPWQVRVSLYRTSSVSTRCAGYPIDHPQTGYRIPTTELSINNTSFHLDLWILVFVTPSYRYSISIYTLQWNNRSATRSVEHSPRDSDKAFRRDKTLPVHARNGMLKKTVNTRQRGYHLNEWLPSRHLKTESHPVQCCSQFFLPPP